MRLADEYVNALGIQKSSQLRKLRQIVADQKAEGQVGSAHSRANNAHWDFLYGINEFWKERASKASSFAYCDVRKFGNLKA